LIHARERRNAEALDDFSRIERGVHSIMVVGPGAISKRYAPVTLGESSSA
jgi:hypothetical protein